MPFKSFAHLARVSFAKGFAHGYAPPAVFAGQSSYATTTNSLGQFHNYPVSKLAKAAHLSNGFAGASGSSGAGAKAGYTGQSSGGDSGLAQYYAAWQHAQQTGDDSEWKKHQTARRIGWKTPAKSSSTQASNRRNSTSAADQSRPSLPPTGSRSFNESIGQTAEDVATASTGADVVAQSDATNSEDIDKNGSGLELSASTLAEGTATQVEHNDEATQTSIERDGSQDDSTSADLSHSIPSTQLTSPITSDAALLSERIIELGQQDQYGEIPVLFELMLRDGVVPSVEAYNQIILAAIELGKAEYQVWPRALEIYSSMTLQSVQPNEDTFTILIDFLASRALRVHGQQTSLDQRRSRYGDADGSFALQSTNLLHELYCGDNSIAFATKLYRVARAKFDTFVLPAQSLDVLLRACIQSQDVTTIQELLKDMNETNVSVDTALYPGLIGIVAKGDIAAAKDLYSQYRKVAIQRGTNDLTDLHVYAALMKAFLDCDMKTSGLSFVERVRQSFSLAPEADRLQQQLADTILLSATIPHFLERLEFEESLTVVSSAQVSPSAKNAALAQICIAAADKNEFAVARRAFSSIDPKSQPSSSVMSLAAMYLRHGQLPDAKAIVAADLAPNSVDFAHMYTSALFDQGDILEGIAVARRMYESLRKTVYPPSRLGVVTDIDQSIFQLGQVIDSPRTTLDSQAFIGLLRMMVENGGFVSPVAQKALAGIGPNCIHELTSQDIAFALHVQADLLAQASEQDDLVQQGRFLHLLETVLNRSISMDPATISTVSEVLPSLVHARPDLVQRWRTLLNPEPSTPTTPAMFSPVPRPSSVAQSDNGSTGSFDPYAYNSDFRASKMIEDQLESTSGRPDNHLTDALGRFRNVRRAGRHLTYRAYAKLITAAGRTKQKNLMHEIMGMAQADVPLLEQFPSTRNGWVTILDAMVSACLVSGERRLATKYHNELLAMGAAPSANTYGLYITNLEGTLDEATEAVKLFQKALAEGVEPTVFLYNAVIGKLGKARRIDDCLFYFGDMQAKGLVPSSVTYGTLVNALCRTSEERFAEEIFDEMESMPNYRPRAAPYNSIIQYFLNTKRDRSKVLAYYERMKRINIKPTSHTYKLLIEAQASLEPVDLIAAEALLDDMKSSGVAPEAVHYGTLIHARGCALHDMAGARALFDQVVSGRLVPVNETLYQNLLESMVANHQVQQTDDVLADMRRHRIQLTPYIANTLIHGWAADSNIDKAKEVYDNLGMRKREPSTYEAMTRGLLGAGLREEAEVVVAECLRKGYPSAVGEKVAGLLGS